MRTNEFSTEELSAKVREIVGPVQDVFRREKGETYDERLIEDSIRICVSRAFDRLDMDLLEMFTTPGRREFDELAALLEQTGPIAKAAVEVEEMVLLAHEFGDQGVFEGRRPFSSSKMAAMMEYLIAKGQNVYKTSLNKLLFYADLTNYYLAGHGMSGAVYNNRPYGPVPAPASPILEGLIKDEKVQVLPHTKTLATGSAVGSSETLTDDCGEYWIG